MFEQKERLKAKGTVGLREPWPDLGSPSVSRSRFKRSTMVWVGPPPPSPKPKRKALWLVRPLSRFLVTVFSTWIGRGRSAGGQLRTGYPPSPACPPPPWPQGALSPPPHCPASHMSHRAGSGPAHGSHPAPPRKRYGAAGRETGKRERPEPGLGQSPASQTCPSCRVTPGEATLLWVRVGWSVQDPSICLGRDEWVIWDPGPL